MQRKALWIAAMTFSAFSVPALAADGDSPRWEAAQQQESPGGSSPPGDSEPQGSSGSSSGAPSNMPSFSQADADKNGLVDPDEASAAGLGFSGADRNSDGDLTRDEYETATGRFGE